MTSKNKRRDRLAEKLQDLWLNYPQDTDEIQSWQRLADDVLKMSDTRLTSVEWLEMAKDYIKRGEADKAIKFINEAIWHIENNPCR